MTAEPVTSRRTIEVASPRDGREVGTVTVTEPAEVEAAVARARVCFERWGSLTHKERRAPLRAYTRTVLANMDRVAATVAAETGKAHGEALAEVTAALTAMDYYWRNGGKLLRRKAGKSWPFVNTKGWTEYHPRGVAGVISPWNYPFYLPLLSVFQALTAGCTVVLKPSETAPHSGDIIAELAAEAGLPPDAVVTIHGYGDTGQALVESSIDIIAFTGSTEIGRQIAATAAQSLKPTVLELGGKDAMIVLEDANLKNAANAAVTFGVFNAGQTCVGVERVYVVDEAYDDFMTHALRSMQRLTVGDGSARDIGPLVTTAQANIVEAQVADAVAKGAALLHGGARIDGDHGSYFEPTLLTGVDHSMDVMRDETFGPVLAVMRVADEKTALAQANDSRYGLHGSVWTADKSRGRWVASQMETGTVAINDHLINFFYPSIPLAGMKDSGTGAVLGEEGLKNFTIQRSITQARSMPTTKMMGAWLPRRVGPGWWRFVAKSLFGWRR